METEEIDGHLARLDTAANLIAANLVDLDDHPSYLLLKAGGLRGATASRLAAPLVDAPLLWEWLTLLRDVIEQAKVIRDDRRLTSWHRQQLRELLTGSSIVLSSTQVPVEQRGLLQPGTSEQRITPDELLDRMRASYEAVRDGVADVDAVWRSITPRVDAATTTLHRLAGELKSLGVREPTVTMAQRRRDEIQTLLVDDPLALDLDVGPELDRLVADAANQLVSLRKGHDELDTDLASTEATLAEIRVLRAAAAAALAEATAKVTDAVGLVAVPDGAAIDGPRGLAGRLDELRGDTSSPWSMRRQRLDAWIQTAERFRTQLVRAQQRNQTPLDRRDELRGLLSAYHVKGAAIGRAEDRSLAEVHDAAHNELYTAPTDLAVAERLVTSYGDALRARRNPS